MFKMIYMFKMTKEKITGFMTGHLISAMTLLYTLMYITSTLLLRGNLIVIYYWIYSEQNTDRP